MLQVPRVVPRFGDAVDARAVVVEDGRRDVNAELVGDDVRRHQRRGREQLPEIDERAVGRERHAGPLLARRAVDGRDVAVAGLVRRVETREPARLRRPGQHQVVLAGVDGFAVGIHRLVVDHVVEHQWGATDDGDGAEVVVTDDLSVGTVVVEDNDLVRRRSCARTESTIDSIRSSWSFGMSGTRFNWYS